jgi:hypothetical protein
MSEDEKVSTYGERKKALKEELLTNYSFTGWSQRPNTCVEIRFTRPDGSHIVELGFSKVNSPDKWSAEEGIRIAIEKAAARVAKKLLLSDEELEKMWPPIEEGSYIEGSISP